HDEYSPALGRWLSDGAVRQGGSGGRSALPGTFDEAGGVQHDQDGSVGINPGPADDPEARQKLAEVLHHHVPLADEGIDLEAVAPGAALEDDHRPSRRAAGHAERTG